MNGIHSDSRENQEEVMFRERVRGKGRKGRMYNREYRAKRNILRRGDRKREIIRRKERKVKWTQGE